jgi:DUF1680 family protein
VKPTSRRNFLQVSGVAASALTLRPLSGLAEAAPVEAPPQQATNPVVRAFEDKMVVARPVPLNRVRITGGPLYDAQQVTAKYLLSLEPDRMIYYYRLRAGLPARQNKDGSPVQPYGGWDGDNHNLTGHIAGHHLSAVSYMYLATGDARFKERADYIVSELKLVQDKQGDGYMSALEIGRKAFGEVSKGDIRPAAFDLNGMWSPWYTLHKTFAGLRDAYRHTGNPVALAMSVKWATWAEGILAPLSEQQMQYMLNTEHGGMNEVLADLYADTGDKRWLNLSLRFEHHAFTDALKRHQDNLSGKHGNCQIPKLIGSAARYGYTGDPADIMAASFFWDRVAQHHSYATGGHGLDEYFGPPDVLSTRVEGRTCESCNVYNMLKLTRRLFSLRPDAFYSDFHERALFNHVLGSIDKADGRTSYMVPVGHGVQQEYQNMLQSFTCCVGSGMESHALHGDGVYYESADKVWVTLFAPSTADCKVAGVSLKMDADFPDGDHAKLTVTAPVSKMLTIAVRRPAWAGDGFKIAVNGQGIDQPAMATLRQGGAGGRSGAAGNESAVVQPSGFVEIRRTWKTGDTIDIALPKTVRVEPTPDNHTVAALMWGPLVLAGDMGPRREGRGAPPSMATPALVGASQPVADWVVAGAKPGDFVAKGVSRVPGQTPPAAADVNLVPFYRADARTYTIYFDVLTPMEFDGRVSALAAERDRMKKLEAATTAYVQPGDPSETAANLQTDQPNARLTNTNNRRSRGGPGWFSYDVAVDPAAPMSLVVTYFNPNGQAPVSGDFTIQVDGTTVAHFESNPSTINFFDTTYAIPATLTRGKTKVTVKFAGDAPNGRVAPIFGVRLVKGGA